MKSYLSLVKFSHTIFAMPFAMVGFFMAVNAAQAEINIRLLLLVIGCMVTARNAAMAFNRYADRFIDAENPRTAVREIPAGIIRPSNALAFTIINCVLFVVFAGLINMLCLYLSPIALAVVLGYSYTKRFTALCHLVLGAGLALAPIGAYIAVTNHFDLAPVLLGFAVLFWVSGFDIIYALQDESFDREKKLHSIPAALGRVNALRLSEFLHLLSAASIISTGLLGGFDWIFWIGVGVFVCLLVYQHLLVKPNDLSRVNLAFFTTNGIGSVVFGIFAIADILWRGNVIGL